MSPRRPFPFFSLLWSVALVAVGSASLYLTYEFIIKPRQAMLDQIADQKKAISQLEQDNQRLETYL